ncbi:hypothetical protein PSTT_03733 [Puccinia striiformis]|uniref:RING-type E3 ubiquitin transferase n=1 Tax=Puccinia striiformis TaxID=27350 RepID=A0A2S4VVH4_9BASI|nr:hypothetical protein PSTT_03733 [Puccinia striiformis]
MDQPSDSDDLEEGRSELKALGQLASTEGLIGAAGAISTRSEGGEEVDNRKTPESDDDEESVGSNDIFVHDYTAPAGIWALEGDQLIRIDRYHPDLEELVKTLLNVWRLDDNRLVAIDPEDTMCRGFLILLITKGILLGPRAFPLPDFVEMFSVTEIFSTLEDDQRMIIADLEQYILGLSNKHPVIELLNEMHPDWLGNFSDELREGVLQDRRHAARSFHAKVRVASSLTLPNEIPRPAHLRPRGPQAEPAGCCICLVKYSPDSEISILACHHTHHFHCRCIMRWISDKTNCPLCRTKV